jgi:hypothetical protein
VQREIKNLGSSLSKSNMTSMKYLLKIIMIVLMDAYEDDIHGFFEFRYL